jgi:hypothetical protein
MQTDDTVRPIEAEWLRNEMNKAGCSNQALFVKLSEQQWPGTVNNISNWRSGLASIPDEVIPMLVRALGRDPEGEALDDVVRFYARRYEWLRPYLRPTSDSALGSPDTRKASELEPVYYGKRGNFQGQRFVLYQDSKGQFVAGETRFEADKRVFSNKEELVRALRAEPELRVRMVPEGVPGAPPSLIHQRSLVWE